MFRRTLSLAVALCAAGVASQLPEFTQQYAQRLGGAIDELRQVVQRFERDSVRVGENREGALARLARSPDDLVSLQGAAMADNMARLHGLEARQAEMAAGPFARILAFLSDPDPKVATATWNSFQPGVPVTAEGAAAGGAGFLLGGGLMAFIGRLFRRRPAMIAAR